ncbi:hypothetical protein C8A01DRAFT_40586 [Parachaetomium inaequale]|uniref:Uncharacterized protein n=1 Tax=Parachaetomium inaequale TaxID=2588326 RepID=A0AAN6SMP1_9PEZI|nr:hypothetical protein C8A01DRAFT_40586 [Parachaetomium inaequale]
MLPRYIALPSSKLAICLAILPLAIPVTYLLYTDRVISRQLKTATGLRDKKKRISTIPPDVPRPQTLPQEVESDDDSECVLAYERIVSQPLPPSSLLRHNPPEYETDLPTVVNTYLRATMTAFSWTPQAFILRASCAGDEAVKQTFDTPFIQNLKFCEGDRVNGFWRVVYRGEGRQRGAGGERVEMALDAPAAYRGPLVKGVIVAGIEREGGDVVFVNETWMWRRQGEAPVLLERGVGKWLHVVLSGWLIMKGLRAVTVAREKAA